MQRVKGDFAHEISCAGQYSLYYISNVSRIEFELTLCLLGIFHTFLLSADFFLKSTVSKNSFRNTIRVLNSLVPDQAQHFVGPDLGRNCLQSLYADDASISRVKQVL